MATLTYRGVLIERIWPSGYYSAAILVNGHLKRMRTDTLAEIRAWIRETLARC